MRGYSSRRGQRSPPPPLPEAVLTPRQALEETRALVEGLNYGPFHFTSNHASNYLPLKGTLPDDREKFLAMIDSALGGKSRIRSEHSRAL